jgi:hypothetical protein
MGRSDMPEIRSETAEAYVGPEGADIRIGRCRHLSKVGPALRNLPFRTPCGLLPDQAPDAGALRAVGFVAPFAVAPQRTFFGHACRELPRATLALPLSRGTSLAKPNYSFEKRQREIAKKKQQEEKDARKREAREAAKAAQKPSGAT